ncbi:MAG: phage Gp37/Gp68 family protein [Spirochaetales bacterium]|nr:phage Gp37/Gp68 family protein [Spirochaetales bacterium]
MAHKTTIEWTEASWNPITGCTKISAGCQNCYAERMAKRLKAMGQRNYANGFNLTVHERMFDLPKKWKKPQRIFVNSMSDLFHEDLELKTIQDIFEIMHECYWHLFQVLTKRSNLLKKYNAFLNWAPNIIMGVTVENKSNIHRIDDLRETDAKTKFISFEPLLSDIGDLNLEGIDWVIVGGESGPNSRSMEKEWVLKIRDICIQKQVPFFFKQWGGTQKKKNGRILDGQLWSELPVNQLQLNNYQNHV